MHKEECAIDEEKEAENGVRNAMRNIWTYWTKLTYWEHPGIDIAYATHRSWDNCYTIKHILVVLVVYIFLYVYRNKFVIIIMIMI